MGKRRDEKGPKGFIKAKNLLHKTYCRLNDIMSQIRKATSVHGPVEENVVFSR